MILINGQSEDRIDISDRGLQYGDGLFETIAYKQGKFEFLDAHLSRLQRGCDKLNISFQQHQTLNVELERIAEALGSQNAVVKVMITRDCGGRGYKADNSIPPTRIISTHDYPNYPSSFYEQGIAVRFCKHTLSKNSALAGIKHLNRLDQVIARNEWDEPDINEGLMADEQGNIIEGTMSNLFIVSNGILITPPIEDCGIEGVMRSQIVSLSAKLGIIVKLNTLSKMDLLKADEVFVCNSVVGVWPVKNIENNHYTIGPITLKIQNELLAST